MRNGRKQEFRNFGVWGAENADGCAHLRGSALRRGSFALTAFDRQTFGFPSRSPKPWT